MTLSIGNRDHRLHVQRVTGRFLEAGDRRVENTSTVRNSRIYRWKKGRGRYSGVGWWERIGTIALIFLAVSCFGQFRISNSSWDSNCGLIINDKAEHFIAGGLIYAGHRQNNVGPLKAVLATSIMAVLWEIKDGYFSYREHGIMGGEGFCWRDLLSSIAGAVIFSLIEIRLN